MNPELKLCPFCGSDDVVFDSNYFAVTCNNCGTEGPFDDANDRAAIDAWNNRAEPVVPPVLYAQIQTLRKYQAWRKGDDERTMDEAGIVPAAVTSALDAVLEIAESHFRDATRYRALRAMPPGIRVQVHVGDGEWEDVCSGDELDRIVRNVMAAT